jgi:hypothetical protein
MQNLVNLLYREEEREMLPLSCREGLRHLAERLLSSPATAAQLARLRAMAWILLLAVPGLILGVAPIVGSVWISMVSRKMMSPFAGICILLLAGIFTLDWFGATTVAAGLVVCGLAALALTIAWPSSRWAAGISDFVSRTGWRLWPWPIASCWSPHISRLPRSSGRSPMR